MAPSAPLIFPSFPSFTSGSCLLAASCADLYDARNSESLSGDFMISVDDLVNPLFLLKSSMDVGMLTLGVTGSELHLHDSVNKARYNAIILESNKWLAQNMLNSAINFWRLPAGKAFHMPRY